MKHCVSRCRTDKIREIAEVTIASLPCWRTRHHLAQAAAAAYDLVIYDRCQPERLPQANTLFIGALPPDERGRGARRTVPPPSSTSIASIR